MKTVLKDIAQRASQIEEMDQVEAVAEKIFLDQIAKLNLFNPLAEDVQQAIRNAGNNAFVIADSYVKTVRHSRAAEMSSRGILQDDMIMSFEP